jgi:hypothetical protein
MDLELAEGLPHSATREKQLERLQDDPTFKLNNSDCPRGSLVWKEVSRSLLLFLLFPISVFLLFPVSSVWTHRWHATLIGLDERFLTDAQSTLGTLADIAQTLQRRRMSQQSRIYVGIFAKTTTTRSPSPERI